jgi:hypothetical protein
MQNKDDVKPINAFSDNPQESVYRDFIDYKTGEILCGLEYWKSLSDTLRDYIGHKEAKLKGNIGVLERRHVKVNGVIHIGKETNEIGKTGTLKNSEYVLYQNNDILKKKILSLTPKDAKAIGMNEETLRRMKKRIKQRGNLKLYKKTLKAITYLP